MEVRASTMPRDLTTSKFVAASAIARGARAAPGAGKEGCEADEGAAEAGARSSSAQVTLLIGRFGASASWRPAWAGLAVMQVLAAAPEGGPTPMWPTSCAHIGRPAVV